ncbi:MAG TPA: flagellar export chaperone FlgN [Baekduia sp.]|nr:flagellar export chaperone FlgN [Baekduia sp.]
MTYAPPTADFGPQVVRHLDEQIVSAQRLLDAVLRQGAAIRARQVEEVLGCLAELQGEMQRRSKLERDRATILHTAAAGLGIAAHTVTLDALAALLDPQTAEHARARSAELRGLLAEVQREHQINRALMRQELTFLSHLTRLLGVDGEDVGYRPPEEPGGSMRATLDPGAAQHRQRRALDLNA